MFVTSWISNGIHSVDYSDNFTDAYHLACEKSEQNKRAYVMNDETGKVIDFIDGRQQFNKTMKDFLEAYRAGTVNKTPNI